MKKFTYNFELSDEAYDLLLAIENVGSAEYRDPEYPTLKDYQEENGVSMRTDNRFLNRNFGGTYYLINDLLEHNLIGISDDSYHITWELTEMGKEIIKQNKTK